MGVQRLKKPLPSGKASSKDSSQIENLQIESPQIENPQNSRPQISNPQIASPEISSPETSSSEISSPSSPQIASPQLEISTIKTPQIETPQSKTPPTTAAKRWTEKLALQVSAFRELPGGARSIRAAVVLAHGLRAEPITLRASALTYLTLLSLIPLLAVVFSIFHAVVGTTELQAHLQNFVLNNLAVGARENFAEYVEHYVQRARGAALGGVGFVFLLSSAVSLMANIEAAFNHTFQVSRPRPIALRVGIYWSMLTLGPLVLSLSVAGTALLQSSSVLVSLGGARELLLWVLPFLATYLGFMLLYLVLPATRVKVSAALIGALFAGTLWELAKIGYTFVSAMSVRKDAIYGSLSAIPVFMLWTYLSWILVLFGARVTYAAQSSAHAFPGELSKIAATKELVAAQVLRQIALDFKLGHPPREAAALSEVLRIPARQLREALSVLSEADLIRELAERGWQPAHPLAQIRLADVYRAVHGSSADGAELGPQWHQLVEHWRAGEQALSVALGQSYEELLEGESGEG